MAKFYEMTPDQQAMFEKWVADRPPVIQEMISSHPPDRLYRNRQGQRVTIESYSEDGTIAFLLSGEYNACVFQRKVFGVPIGELVECDLPDPEEPVGSALTTEEEIKDYLKVKSEGGDHWTILLTKAKEIWCDQTNRET